MKLGPVLFIGGGPRTAWRKKKGQCKDEPIQTGLLAPAPQPCLTPPLPSLFTPLPGTHPDNVHTQGLTTWGWCAGGCSTVPVCLVSRPGVGCGSWRLWGSCRAEQVVIAAAALLTAQHLVCFTQLHKATVQGWVPGVPVRVQLGWSKTPLISLSMPLPRTHPDNVHPQGLMSFPEALPGE